MMIPHLNRVLECSEKTIQHLKRTIMRERTKSVDSNQAVLVQQSIACCAAGVRFPAPK